MVSIEQFVTDFGGCSMLLVQVACSQTSESCELSWDIWTWHILLLLFSDLVCHRQLLLSTKGAWCSHQVFQACNTGELAFSTFLRERERVGYPLHSHIMYWAVVLLSCVNFTSSSAWLVGWLDLPLCRSLLLSVQVAGIVLVMLCVDRKGLVPVNLIVQPTAYDCRNGVGGDVMQFQVFGQGTKRCTILLQVDPDYAYAYTLLAHEYVFIEELDKALACFRNGLRVDSRHYNAWWVSSQLHYLCFLLSFSVSVSHFLSASLCFPSPFLPPSDVPVLSCKHCCSDSLFIAPPPPQDDRGCDVICLVTYLVRNVALVLLTNDLTFLSLGMVWAWHASSRKISVLADKWPDTSVSR